MNPEWEVSHIDDWFLELKVGIASHVFVSPFEIYEAPTKINREQECRIELRIGTSGARSAINLMRTTSGVIVGHLDSKGYKGDMGGISGEIPDPTFGYMRSSSPEYREKDDALRNNAIEGIWAICRM